MKIIIVGDGKMGFALSQKLSGEGHDIVMIDENPDVLRLSSNTQDVGCICGNGVDIDIQKEAGVSTADLMIAVTSRDEVNIICCLLAKKLGARHTIARVRGPEYIKSTLFMREELGLSLSVNPEMAAAAEISRIPALSLRHEGGLLLQGEGGDRGIPGGTGLSPQRGGAAGICRPALR